MEVTDTIATYPAPVRRKLLQIRQWVFEVADEHALGMVTETLKWGELSFQVKSGSTVRIDWKATDPDHYCVFFHCRTRLVETFKELYGDLFRFQGNRAIVLRVNEDAPQDALKHCLSLALRYHRVKHLPLLGA